MSASYGGSLYAVASTNIAINNKMLSAQKTSQTEGFLKGSSLASTFSTTSGLYVSTGVTITEVPNGAKIVYNFWVNNGAASTNGNIRIQAGGNTVFSNSFGNISATQLKDYSGAVTNTGGAGATVDVQMNTPNGGNPKLLGATPNISGIIIFNGTNAIILNGITLANGNFILGTVQLSSLTFSVLSSSTWSPISIGTAGLSGPGPSSQAFVSYPIKTAYQNGLPISVSVGVWSDPDLILVVDFSGDILTVN